MTARSNTRISRAAAAIAALAAVALLGASAGAGQSGRWTQITHAHNGASDNLGLARGRDGTLHVLWAGPARAPYTTISDTGISPAGQVRHLQPVLTGWDSVQPPAAATAKDGSIHVVVSGQKVAGNDDPFAGLNEAVGPGSWTLGPQAFGKFLLTVPSASDVSAGVLPSGQLVTVWRSAVTLALQTGSDPSTEPQNITPAGDLVENPVLAVDQKSGDAIIAFRSVRSGGVFLRRVLPSLGPPIALPQGKLYGPTIAARTSGGVFTAYTPDGARVWLLRFGGKPRAVPVPKGVRVLTAGVAAGPDGRLWLYYGNEQRTYVTRTSMSTSGFEPVQSVASPPGTVQYFRLEGEGSAGPLDLFADVTVDGGAKDGSYQTHVLPLLSVRAATSAGHLTVRVTDAGDPIAGARVTGLPGGGRTTDAHGSIVVSVSGHHTFSLAATKAGYLPAKGKASS